MHYSKINEDTYLLRLERGEKVNETVKSFCDESKIANAWLSGIGSIENPTLGHYDVTTQKYTDKAFLGIFELTNLTGNVAVFEGKPLVHAHVSLSDESMQAFGGHLVEAIVSATVELFLTVLPTSHTKSHNDEIGLKLWDLPNS